MFADCDKLSIVKVRGPWRTPVAESGKSQPFGATIVTAAFGIGGRIDWLAAIRASSQKLDARLHRAVGPFYLHNVVRGISTSGPLSGFINRLVPQSSNMVPDTSSLIRPKANSITTAWPIQGSNVRSIA
jgi:hypothetical protein